MCTCVMLPLQDNSVTCRKNGKETEMSTRENIFWKFRLTCKSWLEFGKEWSTTDKTKNDIILFNAI